MSSIHPVRVPTRDEVLRVSSKPVPAVAQTAATAFAVIGLLVFVAGLFTGHADRVWRAWHVNWIWFTAISMAGTMFVAVQRIVTARWSRPVIRFLEGYSAFLPVAWVFLAISLLLGKAHIFPWVTATPPAAEKVFFLNHGFLTARDLLMFGVLVVLGLWYVYTSVRIDVGLSPERGAGWAAGIRARMRNGFGEERRELHSTHSLQGKLAITLALCFGYFMSMLAYDLSMSLDMHFQSTLYGWWWFMTGWLGALMSFSLLVIWWRRHLNAYDLITETHIHDLGKLCFAFTAFWGYLTFAQFLIMWYGNMGEETHWFRLRFISPWKQITFSVMMLVFIAPFPGLISRAAKVFLPTFILFAVCSLAGTWLQRYDEVYPSLYGMNAVNGAVSTPFGLWEIGVFLLYLGVWGICYLAFMNAFPRMRVALMTSPYRDEMQVPVDPRTMEPLPAHE